MRKCVHVLCKEAHGPVSTCTRVADSAALHQRANSDDQECLRDMFKENSWDD